MVAREDTMGWPPLAIYIPWLEDCKILPFLDLYIRPGNLHGPNRGWNAYSHRTGSVPLVGAVAQPTVGEAPKEIPC